MLSINPHLRENFSQIITKSKFMLVRFIVSNFMSFKEETEFNMLPSSDQKGMKEHIYNTGGIKVLKMAAIYGANGAGKSNLVKAMDAMRDIVTKNDFSSLRKFKLNSECKEKPTTFKIEFTGNSKTYFYGLTVDFDKVIDEWLFETGLINPRMVFERHYSKDRKTNIDFAPEYKRDDKDILRLKLYQEELLSNDTCLLKLIGQTNQYFPEIRDAYQWIEIFFRPLTYSELTGDVFMTLLKSNKLWSFVYDNITTLDIGIKSLGARSENIDDYFPESSPRINEIKQTVRRDFYDLIKVGSSFPSLVMEENGEVVVKSLETYHENNNGENVKFDINEESEGTIKLLELLPWFAFAIENGFTIIIDEIEQSIHVNLLKELIAKFSQDNTSRGQLIFTTHESNLLDQDIFRQDEIWFAEKNKGGETNFYPLSDYKIRTDLDIRKGYIYGRFGAIPFLANLQDLNWETYGIETT